VYNGSSTDEQQVVLNGNASCQASSQYSIYLDPNIPASSNYSCQDYWIGDGQCDDACRTDQCFNDNADCELGCSEDNCLAMFNFWGLLYDLSSGTAHKLNHSVACLSGWSLAAAALNLNSSFAFCMYQMQSYDYNQDSQLNFREFVPLAYVLGGGEDGYKAPQYNCSSCIGMENYNV